MAPLAAAGDSRPTLPAGSLVPCWESQPLLRGLVASPAVPAVPHHLQSAARFVSALVRFVVVLVLLPLAGAAIVLASFLPARAHASGGSPATTVARWTCRCGLKLFRLDVSGDDLDVLSRHRGVLLPNHVSFLDIVALLALTPCRFLAGAEVANIAVIGRAARALGTLFVDRSSDESRAASRTDLALVATPPPVVVFPEGAIPSEAEIWPLRFGAFDTAADAGWDVRMVALDYRSDVVRWRVASLWAAIFATLRSPTRIDLHVTLGPLVSHTELVEVGSEAMAQRGRAFLSEHTGLPLGQPPA